MPRMFLEQPVFHNGEGGNVYRHDAARKTHVVSNRADP